MQTTTVVLDTDRGATITPKGAAVATVYRLRRQLAALDPVERAAILALVADEVLVAA